jgi:hypothetical protein
MKRKYAATERNVRRLLKSPRLFGTWLEKQQDLTLGVARCCWACPIRLYLADILGGNIYIHATCIEFQVNRKPSYIFVEDYKWMLEFMKKIDDLIYDIVPTPVAKSLFKQVSSF